MCASRRFEVVSSPDMPEEMKLDALHSVLEAIDSYTTLEDMTEHVKMFFDDVWTPNWCCIVGRRFGCSIPRDDYGFISVKVNDLTFLLFKSVR
uniref:Dynein light chain n=1 Tax=Trichuris muris TaxID=70415 RepID=A0A5S6QFL1_TRIMR